MTFNSGTMGLDPEPEEEAPVEIEGRALEDHTQDELAALLAERGLPTSGLKAEQIERLVEYILEHGPEIETDPPDDDE